MMFLCSSLVLPIEKNQPDSDRRSEFFNVDERLTILYITLHLIGLLLKEKEESWKK